MTRNRNEKSSVPVVQVPELQVLQEFNTIRREFVCKLSFNYGGVLRRTDVLHFRDLLPPASALVSASQIPFDSYCAAPLLMRQRHFVRSCAACSQDSVGILKSLSEALRVSFERFFWPPCERFPSCSSPWKNFFGSRSSGILVTWPVHLSCASFNRVHALYLCLLQDLCI